MLSEKVCWKAGVRPEKSMLENGLASGERHAKAVLLCLWYVRDGQYS